MTAKKTDKPVIRRDYLPPEKRRGQDGPRIDLSPSDLNNKERKVFDAMGAPGRRVTIAELADVFSRSNVKSRRTSWVRNSLRRLVRGRLVRRVEEGVYERKK